MAQSFEKLIDKALSKAATMVIVNDNEVRPAFDELAECYQELPGKDQLIACEMVAKLIPEWTTRKGSQELVDYFCYRFSPEILKDNLEKYYSSAEDPSARFLIEEMIRLYYDINWPHGVFEVDGKLVSRWDMPSKNSSDES